MEQFRNIGIIGRLGSSQVLETVRRLKKFLVSRHLHVILEDAIAEVLPGHGMQTSSRKMLGEVCDMVIVVGGDGMVALGVMSAPTPENAQVTEKLTLSRARTRAGFIACVERGLASGELQADTDARALAAVFDSFLLGLSTLARDGVPHTVFEAAITGILGVWEASAIARA